MKPVDLFGSENQGVSPFVSAQQRLNCFYELIASGEKGLNIHIRHTPGFSELFQLPLGPVQGFYSIADTLYVVSGGNLYSVSSTYVITLIGSLTGAAGVTRVSMSNNGYQLIIITGVTGWLYTHVTSKQAGTGTVGAVASFVAPITTQGSGYTNGTYTGVALTGGSGTTATGTVVVAGGIVTACTVVSGGINYKVGDILSATSASIGGTGSGFTTTVASVTVNAGTLAKITDPSFNHSTTSVCYMNSSFLIKGSVKNQFQTSGLLDGSLWPALNYATNEVIADGLICVDAWTGTLVLWGDKHIEYWQNTGSYPFPFQQLVGTAQDYGLAAINSRCAVGKTMMFVSSSPTGQYQIMQLNGYAPERISDSAIENIINKFDIVSDAIAFSYNLDSHTFYQITFPNAGRSFLYDMTTKLWSFIQTGVDAGYSRHSANFAIGFNGKTFISTTSSASVYDFSIEYLSDNALPILRRVQTRHLADKGNTLGVDELWLDCDLGHGLAMTTPPQMQLEVSKDNGKTWASPRWTSVGTIGQYSGPRAIWRRLGSARDFVFRFSMTDPVPFILMGCHITARQGTESTTESAFTIERAKK